MSASHQTVRLTRGRHQSPGLGVCVMELASMLADEPFSDRPASTSPVIAAFLRTYNDGVDDGRRQDLYPLAALIVGTARGRRVERERASRCLEFARSLGARAPAGRGAIGIASAEASGSWAALAVLRAGPPSETHPRALAFARELVQFGAQARHPGWPMWLRGRDPGLAVEEALAQPGPGAPGPAARPDQAIGICTASRSRCARLG
ncbi:MAG: hypothetical protein JO046_22855 [Solirubrobacterales bacterium]|nr:hypothetical protein [Solirubrobacterales bacterium]